MTETELWTIQRAAAWEVAEERGALRADGRRVDPLLRPAYRWLMEQMRDRLPHYTGRYPIWAYPAYKPDLRRSQYYRGEECVRVGFTADSSSILTSHIGLWEDVLSGTYCALSETEADAFDNSCEGSIISVWRNGHRNPEKAAEVRASWGRVFDLAATATDPEWCGSPDHVQATLEEVKLEQVFDVRPFTSR